MSLGKFQRDWKNVRQIWRDWKNFEGFIRYWKNFRWIDYVMDEFW